MTMKTKTAMATAAGWAILATPAMAAKVPATVNIETNAQECTAKVTVTFPPNQPPGLAGIQVNADSAPVQDIDRQLNGGGDALVHVPGGPFVYSFQLADNAAHVIDALTLGPVTERTTAVAQLDCREPVPPVIQRVEVPVEVPGPERVVNVPGKTITKTVTKKVRMKVRCEHRWSRKAHRVVIVKGTCNRPPKRHVKLPGTVVKAPSFTG